MRRIMLQPWKRRRWPFGSESSSPGSASRSSRAAVVDKAKALVNHAVTVGLAGSAHRRSRRPRRAVLEHERLGARRVGAGQGATLWVDGTRVTRAGRGLRQRRRRGGEQPVRLVPHAHPSRRPDRAGRARDGRGRGTSGRELLDRAGRRLRGAVPVRARFHSVDPGARLSREPGLRHSRLRRDDRRSCSGSTRAASAMPSRWRRASPAASSRASAPARATRTSPRRRRRGAACGRRASPRRAFRARRRRSRATAASTTRSPAAARVI